ncbi:unnamed protein product, partial [Meganyctiphanes norvegica]
DYCESKAGFLSNIPLDAAVDITADAPTVLPANYPDFDSDSKIPGRHIPRLPYHHLPQHVFYQQEKHLQNHPSRSHHNPYPQLDYPSSTSSRKSSSSSSSDTRYLTNHHHPHRHHHQHHHHHQHSASVGHKLEDLKDKPQDFPITRRSNRQKQAYGIGLDYGPRALGVVATGAGGGNTVDSHPEDHTHRGGGQHGGGGGGGGGNGVGGHRGGGGYAHAYKGSKDVKETYKGPSTPPRPKFDISLPRNITVQRGKTAVLSCRVLNQGDKSVSWIRSKSLAILAVDKYKYSTDQRISVVYNEPNLEWVLRIRGVRTNDSGVYECQVSTKPVISFVVTMDVVDPVQPSFSYPKMSDQQQVMEPPLVKTDTVPRATIINGPEIFVHHGSLINLTCLVIHGTRSPVFVYWFHENQVIDYNWRSGVTVTTEQSRDTTSHLQVTHAQLNDSGKYICRPNHGEEASVRLHVLSGEYQAAMQTNTSTRLSWIPAMFILGTCLGAFLSMCICPHS